MIGKCFLASLLVLYTLIFIGLWPQTWTFEKTTWGIITGTLVTILLTTVVSIIPGFLGGGIQGGLFKLPGRMKKSLEICIYMMISMPSVLTGVAGFLFFSQFMGLGWSVASASLTLSLIMTPVLMLGFSQIISNCQRTYRELNKSLGIGPFEFMLRILPSIKKQELSECVLLGVARSLGDTAAVMLTCGAVTDMPESVFDSVRILNYHIYLLAMETPGGMPEAKSLAFTGLACLFCCQAVFRFLSSERLTKG